MTNRRSPNDRRAALSVSAGGRTPVNPAPSGGPEMTPLFTKTDEFLRWLVPQTERFPRIHRHTVTRRLLDAAFDFQEEIIEANVRRGQARMDRHINADAKLDKVRHYLRQAHQWRWLSNGQYEHASRMTAEIGRLHGGWVKSTREQLASPQAAAGIG